MEKTKCLIIGSGPAAYTAAVYAARAELKPVLYQGMQPGGQLTTTTIIDNFPGFPDGIDGNLLMQQMQKQAERFGTDIRFGVVDKVNLSKRPFIIRDDNGKETEAETLIIATGASAKYLGLPSEKKFMGKGVSACATCDGFFYKGKDVVVVGGGDTAAEEATHLANMCQKVYLVHRRNELRASKAMQKKVFNTKNIEVLWETVVEEILGDDSGVNAVRLKNINNESTKELPVHGYFVAIGHRPNTGIFEGQVEMHSNGYIKTKPDSTQTSIPGVFAAGDVQDFSYRQAVTAAGTGCMAAIEAEKLLNH